MRLLIVENNVSSQQKWFETVQAHWPGKIDFELSNESALSRLGSPYFFPFMVCLADRETILKARDHGVHRFLIKPCEPSQLIVEINTHLLAPWRSKGQNIEVELSVLHHTLNSLCHGPVTHRQLQWLKQRCASTHFHWACSAIDQIIRYMDRPTHKPAEIKNALLELSGQVQLRIQSASSVQYA